MQTTKNSASGGTGLPTGLVLQGTYRIAERLATGGMGEVYLASHERLAGQMAIKVLSRELVNNKEAFVRFGREAAILSSLRHPNIVQVFDFNVTDDGTPFLAMELLDGPDLRRCIEQDGKLAPGRVARIVRQVASALAAAHERGVVHRDLKPDNVVLLALEGQEDFVKVLDFGISRVLWSERLTSESHVLGTPQYMAPEQAQGRLEEIDGRTDQFALAALAWAMLTGRAPFRGESPVAVLYQVINEEADALAGFVDYPAGEIDSVLRRGMAKRREDRYPDIMAFATALAAAVTRPIQVVRAVTVPYIPAIRESEVPRSAAVAPAARPARRRAPSRTAVAALSAAAVFAAVWFGGSQGGLPAPLDSARTHVRGWFSGSAVAAPGPMSVAPSQAAPAPAGAPAAAQSPSSGH